MKKIYLILLSILGMLTATRGQNFVFTPVTTPVGCSPADSYTLYTAFSLEKIVVSQIYSDDGVTGSFAFEVYIHVVNVFAGTVMSTGNFYNYTPTLYSSVPNVPPSITNTSNIVPLGNASIPNVASSTNPTYNGSASALGLVLNGTYTAADTLALFGYDSASLEINLPCIGDQVLDTTTQPLPVVMSALKGRNINGHVNLLWSTYSEINHAGFRILRSVDGQSWSQIDWIPNSNSNRTELTTNYSYVDHLPFTGNNYYKIIQVDRDGKSVQSNTVAVWVGSESVSEISVYPNPADNKLTIHSAIGQKVDYQLRNMLGEMIMEGNMSGNQDLDVKKLVNGLYLLKIMNKIYPVVIYR